MVPPQHRVEAWGDVAGEDDLPAAGGGRLERLGYLREFALHSQADVRRRGLLAEPVEVTDLPAVRVGDPELLCYLRNGHAFPEQEPHLLHCFRIRPDAVLLWA